MLWNNDYKEQTVYTIPQLPFYAVKQFLSWYPNKSADIHWHRDIEFLIPLKGHIMYNVNGNEYLIRENQAIFVNSEQFHFGYSADDTDCEFICIIIPLELFEGIPYIYPAYIVPIIHSARAYHIIDGENAAGQKILQLLKELFSIADRKEAFYELALISVSVNLWKLLNELFSDDGSSILQSDKRIHALQSMLIYIEQNYSDKITLEMLAKAGGVCRSQCCRIFADILHRTPITYLNEYRIARSIKYLKAGNLGITETAAKCGFPNVSYFIKVFHNTMGCSPRQFRKSLKND
ncbi:MAG: AraC family transcriptional regulator [Lachnospiraceae bacterium]|nr:AraC family transcriptional regulator [Lachnospiraceae bacterium]